MVHKAVDHPVLMPMGVVSEEFHLQDFVPTFNEIVGVCTAIGDILMVGNHPSLLFFKIEVLLIKVLNRSNRKRISIL